MNTIARPFGWLLMILYEFVNNYALALFLIALIVRAILLPFQMKGKRGMMRQTRLQPKIAELQKRHGANKQKLNEEMAKLYKEEGVNPASGCLWSFIQMPIMIALFYAIRQPLTIMMGIARDLVVEGGVLYDRVIELINNGRSDLTVEQLTSGGYSEVYIAKEISSPANWESFNSLGIEGLRQISFTLGAIDLSQVPNWQFFWSTDWSTPSIWLHGLVLFFFPIVSGAAQFVSAHIMRKTTPQPTPEAGKGNTMQTVMKFMPLMSVWFGFILPAALSFYWTIGTVLQIGQDIWLTKKYTKILDAEDEVKEKARREKEAELEAKRLETERLKAEGLAAQNRNTSKRKRQKGERQGQREKAAEWEKKKAPPEEKVEKNEPSRVGNRRYARGRAYDPDRYAHLGSEHDGEDASGSDDDRDEIKADYDATEAEYEVVDDDGTDDEDADYDEEEDEYEDDEDDDVDDDYTGYDDEEDNF